MNIHKTNLGLFLARVYLNMRGRYSEYLPVQTLFCFSHYAIHPLVVDLLNVNECYFDPFTGLYFGNSHNLSPPRRCQCYFILSSSDTKQNKRKYSPAQLCEGEYCSDLSPSPSTLPPPTLLLISISIAMAMFSP